MRLDITFSNSPFGAALCHGKCIPGYLGTMENDSRERAQRESELSEIYEACSRSYSINPGHACAFDEIQRYVKHQVHIYMYVCVCV